MEVKIKSALVREFVCYTARTHVSTQYCQSVLPALPDESQPRTSIRLWSFCYFGSYNAQGFAMKEPTSVILALWTKGKNNPCGLPVKDLRGHAVPDFYSKGISNYCANCHSYNFLCPSFLL